MPLPTPNPSEDREAFTGRCMGNPTALADFPDESQRAAVCYAQWRDEKVRAAMLALDELRRML